MAVTQINELPSSRTSSLDNKGKRSHTRIYQAVTDNNADDSYTVLGTVVTTTGIDIGTSFPTDALSLVTSITSRNTDDAGLRWEITFDYETPSPSEEEEAVHPLSRPAEISWGFDQFERIVDFDINGDKIANSAGDAFDPPVLIDDSRSRLTIVKNYSSFDDSWADGYRDTLNDALFYGKAAGTVKVSNISATSQTEKIDDVDVVFWRVTFEFHVNKDGWKKKILDQGMRQKVSGERKNILVQGQPVSDPVPLDGGGMPLEPDDLPFFHEYEVYSQQDFSVFGLI